MGLPSDSITLRWSCTDKQALTWLLNHTYQLSGSNDSVGGIIVIPCLGSINPIQKLPFITVFSIAFCNIQAL